MADKNIGRERIITSGNYSHGLTCVNVFSCDSKEIIYDTITQGQDADKSVLESVNVATGDIRLIYKNNTGARGAVVTCHPTERKACFIKGLDYPEKNGAYRIPCRQGAIVNLDDPEDVINIDARNIYAPYTVGALRGGSHVHVFSPDGKFITDTYDDAVVADLHIEHDCREGEANLRNVQICLLNNPVTVPDLPGNVSGTAFSYVVAELHSDPKPGTDEIRTCEEETVIGKNGYIRANGTRKERALAVIGETRTKDNEPCAEVFVVDLPEGEIREGDGPLTGTPTTRPRPPKGCEIRRLTRLCDRKFPGIRGSRHWLRTTPDGAWVGFFAMDDNGILQAFKAEIATGKTIQLSHNEWPVNSQMTISPDGQFMYYSAGQRLLRTHMYEGYTETLLEPQAWDIGSSPVCVSPDGHMVAYNRLQPNGNLFLQQIAVYELD